MRKDLVYSIQGLLQCELLIDLASGYWFYQPNPRNPSSLGMGGWMIFCGHWLIEGKYQHSLTLLPSFCTLSHAPLQVVDALSGYLLMAFPSLVFFFGTVPALVVTLFQNWYPTSSSVRYVFASQKTLLEIFRVTSDCYCSVWTVWSTGWSVL